MRWVALLVVVSGVVACGGGSAKRGPRLVPIPDELQSSLDLAGHLRVRVSDDGNTVLAATALSRACLITEPMKLEGMSQGPYVDHLIDPTPIETHVFASYLYAEQVWVGAGGRTWVVNREQIYLVD